MFQYNSPTKFGIDEDERVNKIMTKLKRIQNDINENNNNKKLKYCCIIIKIGLMTETQEYCWMT
jgi:hypothetical protein